MRLVSEITSARNDSIGFIYVLSRQLRIVSNGFMGMTELLEAYLHISKLLTITPYAMMDCAFFARLHTRRRVE